jgi:hypothetical protein
VMTEKWGDWISIHCGSPAEAGIELRRPENARTKPQQMPRFMARSWRQSYPRWVRKPSGERRKPAGRRQVYALSVRAAGLSVREKATQLSPRGPYHVIRISNLAN